MPRVSVVVAAYRSEAFLPAALASVRAQRFDDLELVVVDDGSPTRAAEAQVAEFAAEVAFRVTYHHQENRGPAAARNTGLALSGGELVAFLDADDVFTPDKLAVQVARLDGLSPAHAFVCGAHRVVPAGGGEPSTVVPPPLDGRVYDDLVHDRVQLLGTAAFLHRRTALEAVGGYDESLRNNEDLDLTLRLARAYPVATHPEVVFENRQRKGSLSFDDPGRALANALAFLDKLEREDPALDPALLRRKRQRAYFNAARKHLELERDFAAFRRTLDAGVRAAGRPSTWRGWAAWCLARSGPLGAWWTRRRA